MKNKEKDFSYRKWTSTFPNTLFKYKYNDLGNANKSIRINKRKRKVSLYKDFLNNHYELNDLDYKIYIELCNMLNSELQDDNEVAFSIIDSYNDNE